jgi:hypothetical protein
MAKKAEKLIAKATEAFGELPADVRALGGPLSVHPLSGLGKAMPPATVSLVLYVVAGVFLLAAAFGGLMFLLGQPIGTETPDVWLAISVPGILIGGFCGSLGWSLGKPSGDGTDPNTIRGLMLFPDALVHAPASKSVWTVVTADGRQIGVSERLEESSTAISNLTDSVMKTLFPKLLAKVDAGKKVMFGTFGVSRRFVWTRPPGTTSPNFSSTTTASR